MRFEKETEREREREKDIEGFLLSFPVSVPTHAPSGEEKKNRNEMKRRPELVKTRVLELNASDERGIGIVRSKIKAFASGAVGSGGGGTGASAGYPCPPYKLLILDEADAMTVDAQSALRRTMETHSRVTRFVFICNYVSRIIEPLASRCAKFRFAPLAGGAADARVAAVCASEGVALLPGAREALERVAGGDLRRAITVLQSAVRLKGPEVSAETLEDVSGAVPAAAVEAIFAAARGKKRSGEGAEMETEDDAAASSRSFDALQRAVDDAVAEGWPAQGILLGLQAAVVAEAGASGRAKGAACAALARADRALVDGGDESVQLLAAASGVRDALMGA